jgi:hypothetical protein
MTTKFTQVINNADLEKKFRYFPNDGGRMLWN